MHCSKIHIWVNLTTLWKREYVSSQDSWQLPLCTLSQYLVRIKAFLSWDLPPENPQPTKCIFWLFNYLLSLHLRADLLPWSALSEPCESFSRPLKGLHGFLSRRYTVFSFKKISKTFWLGHSKRINSENKIKQQLWKAKKPHMQGNPVSIITKTDQHQTEDITFPQVKREFVSSVQTGVEFCAIEKPSCVVDGHFITYHRRLRPTAFSLDNLRKTAIRIKIMEIKSAHWTRIANT